MKFKTSLKSLKTIKNKDNWLPLGGVINICLQEGWTHSSVLEKFLCLYQNFIFNLFQPFTGWHWSNDCEIKLLLVQLWMEDCSVPTQRGKHSHKGQVRVKSEPSEEKPWSICGVKVRIVSPWHWSCCLWCNGIPELGFPECWGTSPAQVLQHLELSLVVNFLLVVKFLIKRSAKTPVL